MTLLSLIIIDIPSSILRINIIITILVITYNNIIIEQQLEITLIKDPLLLFHPLV